MKRLALALAFIGSAAHADPGYLNQDGCHYGTHDGWRGRYHCHHAARSYYDGNRGLRDHAPRDRDRRRDHRHSHSSSNNDAMNILLGIIVLDALLSNK